MPPLTDSLKLHVILTKTRDYLHVLVSSVGFLDSKIKTIMSEHQYQDKLSEGSVVGILKFGNHVAEQI